MVEERIVSRLDAGDPEGAAAEVIRSYGPQVLGYLTRVLGSGDDAQDAFSFFAEAVWKGIGRFEGRSSVRVWAYRVAWTAALRVTSDGWRRRREPFPTSMASRVAAEVRSRSALAAERESAEVERLRGALEPAEQSLLVLRVDRHPDYTVSRYNSAVRGGDRAKGVAIASGVGAGVSLAATAVIGYLGWKQTGEVGLFRF
jgi:RNA polymerase sigma-70 factor (ECF subfamily)